MDIKSNADTPIPPGHKNLAHYDQEDMRRRLLARLEEVKRMEDNPELIAKAINDAITRQLKEMGVTPNDKD